MTDADTPWSRLRERLAARRPLLRVVPERRLALVVAVASLLWLLPGAAGSWAALGGLAVIATLVAVDWALLPGRRHLTVERHFPAAVGLGDREPAEYVIESRWPRALEVRLTDEMPAGVSGGAGEASVSLPRRGSARVEVEVGGMRRGLIPLGRIALRSRTRLGLLAARAVASPGDAIRIVPSLTGVRRFRLLAVQHRLHTAGVRVLRQRGDSRAFAGLREYALGDDPRHIDWKATARRRRHIVREFTVEQSQTVFTLIESGRAMTQLAGDFSRLEHALSAALVLTDVAATSGDRVGTLVFDHEVRAFAPPRRGRAALHAVRDALVPVTATMAEPDYAGAFRFLSARQRRRALMVFFTDVIDERASRALVAHVTRSAGRHLVVVVALRNDAVFEAAVPLRTDDDSLYASAAAEELLIGRLRALNRMRRAGVVVLDVSPREMVAAVVNRYLEIKARGALL